MPVEGTCRAQIPSEWGSSSAELVAVKQAQAGNSVGDAALVELREAGNFFGSGGHDQLAALFVGDGVLGAEALHGGASGDAVARLERAGAVVEAGVDDAGVVSGLMSSDAVFLVDDDEAVSRKAAGEVEGGGESDDARADDEKVGLAIGHKACLVERIIIRSAERKRCDEWHIGKRLRRVRFCRGGEFARRDAA